MVDVINEAQDPLNTIEILRMYVKEQSCKVPHGYQAFQTEGNQDISTEMNVNSQALAKDVFEVTLNFTITAKLQQRTIYQVLVQQAAVIRTKITEEEKLANLLNIVIPTMLYPYARKVVADAVFNAGFPSIFLPVVDFSAIKQQNKQEEPVAYN